MADNYDFILGLRAIRDYDPKPISKDRLDAILEAGRWTGSSKNQQSWSFIAVVEPERIQALADHGDYTQPLRDSTAAIVLVREAGGNMFDIGRAAQNMMLAARAIGVASCPITLHRDKGVASLLEIPEGAVARYAIALGYPAEDAEPRRYGGRKPASRVIKMNSY